MLQAVIFDLDETLLDSVGPARETRKALAFSTPQRNTGIAMVIAAGNFAGTSAVTVTVVLAVFLTLSGLVMQFVLRKL